MNESMYFLLNMGIFQLVMLVFRVFVKNPPTKSCCRKPTRMEALHPIDLDGSVISLAAGAYHTCILRGSVTWGRDVTCFGAGGYGQLGDGSFSNIGDSPNEKLGGNLVKLQ